MALIQTWNNNILLNVHIDASVIDFDLDSKSQEVEKAKI